MEERALPDRAFTMVLSALLEEAAFEGRNFADCELYDDIVTPDMMSRIWVELKVRAEESEAGEALLDGLEKRLPDERRLAVCGMLVDAAKWSSAGPGEIADELMAAVQWLRDSDERLRRMPAQFMALYGSNATIATFVAQAELGVSSAKWWLDCERKSGSIPMHTYARTMFSDAVIALSRRFSRDAPMFDMEMFTAAAKHHEQCGSEYARLLADSIGKLPDGLDRANAAVALFEMAGKRISAVGESVGNDEYCAAVGGVIHLMKQLDAVCTWYQGVFPLMAAAGVEA